MLQYKSWHKHPCPKWISEYTDSYFMSNLLYFDSCTWWLILYIISNSLWKPICVSSVLWVRLLFLSILSQNYARDLTNFWVSFKTHLHWNIWVKIITEKRILKGQLIQESCSKLTLLSAFMWSCTVKWQAVNTTIVHSTGLSLQPPDGLSGGTGQRCSILLKQNFAHEWNKHLHVCPTLNTDIHMGYEAA